MAGPAVLVAAIFVGLNALAAPAPSPAPLPPDRSLAFFNIHTNESLAVEYCRDGCFQTSSLEKIDYILRDDRAGEVKKMDSRLLDLLYTLKQKMGVDGPFHVISGYRSPQTNEYLRRQGGGGVAANSLHLVGQAIDIRLPGVKLVDLYHAALAMKAGGVGYYPSLDFIHVDVGRVRTW